MTDCFDGYLMRASSVFAESIAQRGTWFETIRIMTRIRHGLSSIMKAWSDLHGMMGGIGKQRIADHQSRREAGTELGARPEVREHLASARGKAGQTRIERRIGRHHLVRNDPGPDIG